MSKYYKIITSLFLVVFIVSTTGVVLNKHKCGVNVKSVAAFTEAEGCEHSQKNENTLPPCHKKDQNEKKDCCKEDSEQFKNNEKTLTKPDKNVNLYNYVIYYFLPILIDFTKTHQNNEIIQGSDPPPKTSQIIPLHKLFNIFII